MVLLLSLTVLFVIARPPLLRTPPPLLPITVSFNSVRAPPLALKTAKPLTVVFPLTVLFIRVSVPLLSSAAPLVPSVRLPFEIVSPEIFAVTPL